MPEKITNEELTLLFLQTGQAGNAVAIPRGLAMLERIALWSGLVRQRIYWQLLELLFDPRYGRLYESIRHTSLCLKLSTGEHDVLSQSV